MVGEEFDVTIREVPVAVVSGEEVSDVPHPVTVKHVNASAAALTPRSRFCIVTTPHDLL